MLVRHLQYFVNDTITINTSQKQNIHIFLKMKQKPPRHTLLPQPTNTLSNTHNDVLNSNNIQTSHEQISSMCKHVKEKSLRNTIPYPPPNPLYNTHNQNIDAENKRANHEERSSM